MPVLVLAQTFGWIIRHPHGDRQRQTGVYAGNFYSNETAPLVVELFQNFIPNFAGALELPLGDAVKSFTHRRRRIVRIETLDLKLGFSFLHRNTFRLRHNCVGHADNSQGN